MRTSLKSWAKRDSKNVRVDASSDWPAELRTSSTIGGASSIGSLLVARRCIVLPGSFFLQDSHSPPPIVCEPQAQARCSTAGPARVPRVGIFWITVCLFISSARRQFERLTASQESAPTLTQSPLPYRLHLRS